MEIMKRKLYKNSFGEIAVSYLKGIGGRLSGTGHFGGTRLPRFLWDVPEELARIL